jgi:hypothetical protein
MRNLLRFLVTTAILGVIYLILLFLDASAFSQYRFLVQYQSLDLPKRAEVLKSFIEAMAFIIAGLWTYELYIKNRYDHPYPKIRHRIEHHKLEDGIIYLSVFVTLTNEGKTKLDLKDGKVYIRQVFPMSERIKGLFKKSVEGGKSTEVRNGEISELFIDSGQRIGWDTLGARDWGRAKKQKLAWLKLRKQNPIIEPGQTKEFQFDFFIDESIAVIMAISYINKAKGWGLATFYSLKESKTN